MLGSISHDVQIFWMGKPDPIIYEVAMDMLQLPKEKVIAIGDSLQHDIQGTKACRKLQQAAETACRRRSQLASS